MSRNRRVLLRWPTRPNVLEHKAETTMARQQGHEERGAAGLPEGRGQGRGTVRATHRRVRTPQQTVPPHAVVIGKTCRAEASWLAFWFYRVVFWRFFLTCLCCVV